MWSPWGARKKLGVSRQVSLSQPKRWASKEATHGSPEATASPKHLPPGGFRRLRRGEMAAAPQKWVAQASGGMDRNLRSKSWFNCLTHTQMNCLGILGESARWWTSFPTWTSKASAPIEFTQVWVYQVQGAQKNHAEPLFRLQAFEGKKRSVMSSCKSWVLQNIDISRAASMLIFALLEAHTIQRAAQPRLAPLGRLRSRVGARRPPPCARSHQPVQSVLNGCGSK